MNNTVFQFVVCFVVAIVLASAVGVAAVAFFGMPGSDDTFKCTREIRCAFQMMGIKYALSGGAVLSSLLKHGFINKSRRNWGVTHPVWAGYEWRKVRKKVNCYRRTELGDKAVAAVMGMTP